MENKIENEELQEDFITKDVTEAIIKSMVGPKTDSSKVVVNMVLSKGIKTEEGFEAKEVSSCASNNAEVYLERRGDMVQLDIAFDSNSDQELNKMWGILEGYGEKVHEELSSKFIDEPSGLLIQMMPKEYEGEYFIDITFPILWCLMPKNPNSHIFKIRILFDADSFELYKVETDMFSGIEAALDFENKNQESMESKIQREKEERNQFLEKRIEIRKNQL